MSVLETLNAAAKERRRRLSPPNGRRSSELEIIPTVQFERESRKRKVLYAISQLSPEIVKALDVVTDERNSVVNVTIVVEKKPPRPTVSAQAISDCRVKVAEILDAVAQHYGVTKDEIKSQRRHAGIVRPRQVAMYLARELTPASFPMIGRHIGKRDHSSVFHACEKISKLVKEDEKLAWEISAIKAMLTGTGDGPR